MQLSAVQEHKEQKFGSTSSKNIGINIIELESFDSDVKSEKVGLKNREEQYKSHEISLKDL